MSAPTLDRPSTLTRPQAQPRTAAQVAAATPAGRDRTVDFVRVASMVVVVLGHWLLAVVALGGTGSGTPALQATNLLAAAPAVQWLTLVLQVMPLFFVVGGFAHATSLVSRERSGASLGSWWAGRVLRLVLPTLPLLALWVPVLALLERAGALPPDLLRAGGAVLGVPLWFLGVYLIAVAAAPAALAAHRRFGVRAVVALVVAAIATDAGSRVLGVPGVGVANFAFVWLALHQLGFAWHDGSLLRSTRTAVALAVGGATGLAVLIAGLGYPLSMVGVPGAVDSNNSPPTVALLALGAWQVGLLLLARPALQRWLAKPRVWAVVALAGSRAMTMYLWHMTALILAVCALQLTGLWPQVTPLTGGWWALEPLWLLALAVTLTPLVAVARRWEDRTAGLPPTASAARALAACVLGIGGYATIAAGGMAGGPAAAGAATAVAAAALLARTRRSG